MSFSKDLILSLAILGVVLESDLGRKKIGWFRVARPVIVAAAIIPLFFTTLPTSGHDLLLQGLGAVIGIVLGLLAVSPAFMAVGFDPGFQTWWTKARSKPGTPAAFTLAGARYALIWIAATVARLAFAWGSQHAFPHALGVFLTKHQLSAVALTNTLIFLPLGMDVFRSVGLLARGSSALRRGRLEAQPGAYTSANS
jgi:hypothetical protein